MWFLLHFQGENPIGDDDGIGLYEVVRKEVRHAVEEIRTELQKACVLLHRVHLSVLISCLNFDKPYLVFCFIPVVLLVASLRLLSYLVLIIFPASTWTQTNSWQLSHILYRSCWTMNSQPSPVMIVSNQRVQKFCKLLLRSEETTQPNWNRHVMTIFLKYCDCTAFFNGLSKLSWWYVFQFSLSCYELCSGYERFIETHSLNCLTNRIALCL